MAGEVCMAGGVCVAGGMHGRGCAWWGVCMAGGSYMAGGNVWQGVCVAGGACVAGGMHGREVCVVVVGGCGRWVWQGGVCATHMVNERVVRILLECILVSEIGLQF